MDIVYASNDLYARHLAVSMISLFDRNQQAEEITVYVLSVGITEESRQKLQKIADQYHRNLELLDLTDIRDRFDYEIDTRGFDISAMSRLFIGTLLPRTVKRVLYLDCDTVVVQSIGKLWNLDLKGHVAGAVMEPTIYQVVKQEIGLEEQDPYFNSGVLLIDLERWRADGAEKRLLDFYGSKNGSLFACDQDTINGALKGEILPMTPRYNFFTNYRYFSYEELCKHGPSYRQVEKRQFCLAKKHPVIIHYMGDERPWIAGNLNHYRRAYEKYLAMTSWKGAKKQAGKRVYMLLYHGMDYLTVVCPALRWEISRRLGMKVVDARKQGGKAAKTAGTVAETVAETAAETVAGTVAGTAAGTTAGITAQVGEKQS